MPKDSTKEKLVLRIPARLPYEQGKIANASKGPTMDARNLGDARSPSDMDVHGKRSAREPTID
jgi:hypothetical protein